jgi:hypothetical protein
MEVEDRPKVVKKKLEIAQSSDREKVLSMVHQLFGTTADWWETYRNTHPNANAISWNEFKAHFMTHYVTYNTLKLNKKEFSDLNQGGMMMNGYLNQFIQLSRYAIDNTTPTRRSKICFSRVSMMRSSFSCSTQTTQISSIWWTRPPSSKRS